MARKYPKTTGYYVYVHVTPNKLCYFGMSKQQPCRRWFKKLYIGTTLEPYIKQYGWDNIEHMVIQDGLTKHQAQIIEDWFIVKATKDGFCFNKKRSGGFSTHKERKRVYAREYMRKYCQTQKRKKQIYEYNQRPEVKEHRLEYQREYRKRPEVKEVMSEKQCKYQREYRKRPEVKERRREYQRQYRLKKKQQTNKEQ